MVCNLQRKFNVSETQIYMAFVVYVRYVTDVPFRMLWTRGLGKDTKFWNKSQKFTNSHKYFVDSF